MGFKEIKSNGKIKIAPTTAEPQTIGLNIECMNKKDPSHMQFVPLSPPHHIKIGYSHMGIKNFQYHEWSFLTISAKDSLNPLNFGFDAKN